MGYGMNKKELREDAKTYFVPIILGSNRKAHALSAKIARKYRISATVADTKRSFWRFLDPFSAFLVLASDAHSIISEQISTYALGVDYTLPILIPCSDEYEAYVSAQRTELEKVFVICSAKNFFASSPLSVMD
jgi:hypothetical protein